jgi:hypothetical protein
MRLLAKLRRRHPLPAPSPTPVHRPVTTYSPDFFPVNTPYRVRHDEQLRTDWQAFRIP